MAGDGSQERCGGYGVQRGFPPADAGRIEKRYRQGDEIADGREVGGGRVDPDVRVGGGVGRQMEFEAGLRS